MKNHTKRIISLILSALLVICSIPVSVFAERENTPKEEVVYINLKADGSVEEINIVNIFDLDEAGEIIDYGRYENLRNMTTTDEIDYKDETVTIDAKAGKLYYEGKLKENIIPWNISVKYFIDGVEYPADKLGGMKGYLEIKMSVEQNEECDSSFFEGYALQVSFTLNTDKAENIEAEGATVANVGKNKQLTYTILPNTEKNLTLSADVKDFEMSGISVNGIRMNLGIDIEESSLLEKIDEVIGAVGDLDEGAGELESGADELQGATKQLKTATGKLADGSDSLLSGAGELKDGLQTLKSKNSELKKAAMSAYKGLCTAAETQLNAKLTENGMKTVSLTPENYSKVLLGVLAELDADAVYNKAYNAALSEVKANVQAQADALYAGYIQSNANDIYKTYILSQADTLYNSVGKEAVVRELTESGAMGREQALAYLETPEGKVLISNAVSAMTDEQKEQIISSALISLTAEQKEQILSGAYDSLTDVQKAEIREGYIEQLMADEEVTSKINEAMKEVGSAAAQVSELKGQLDSYGAFYNGLVDYTDGVRDAAKGAAQLESGLTALNDGASALKKAVGELHIGVGKLKDGTEEMKDGTEEFAAEVDGMDKELSDGIDSAVSSLTGEDVPTVSFASKRNTNIKSVQFVIKTEGIEIKETENANTEPEKKLTFWQKLLRLFGLY